MAAVNVQCIAEAALRAMESGEYENEHYDTTKFVCTFPQVVSTNGYTELRVMDYTRILQAMIQQCCKHGEETPCTVCRCSYHVREYLETELDKIFRWMPQRRHVVPRTPQSLSLC